MNVQHNQGGTEWVPSDDVNADSAKQSETSQLGTASDKSDIKGNVKTDTVRDESMSIVGTDVSDLSSHSASRNPVIGSRRTASVAQETGVAKPSAKSRAEGMQAFLMKGGPEHFRSQLEALVKADIITKGEANLIKNPVIADALGSKANEMMDKLEGLLGGPKTAVRVKMPKASPESLGPLPPTPKNVEQSSDFDDLSELPPIPDDQGVLEDTDKMGELPPTPQETSLRRWASSGSRNRQASSNAKSAPSLGRARSEGTPKVIQQNKPQVSGRPGRQEIHAILKGMNAQIMLMSGSDGKTNEVLDLGLETVVQELGKISPEEAKSAIQEFKGQFDKLGQKLDPRTMKKFENKLSKLETNAAKARTANTKEFDALLNVSKELREGGGRDNCLVIGKRGFEVVPKSEASTEERLAAIRKGMKIVNKGCRLADTTDATNVMNRLLGDQSREIQSDVESDLRIQRSVSEHPFLIQERAIGQIAPNYQEWTNLLETNNSNIDFLFNRLGGDKKQFVNGDGEVLTAADAKAPYERFKTFAQKFATFQNTRNPEDAPDMPKADDNRQDAKFKATIEEVFKETTKALDPDYKNEKSETAKRYAVIASMFKRNKGSNAQPLDIPFISNELQWFTAELKKK